MVVVLPQTTEGADARKMPGRSFSVVIFTVYEFILGRSRNLLMEIAFELARLIEGQSIRYHDHILVAIYLPVLSKPILGGRLV